MTPLDEATDALRAAENELELEFAIHLCEALTGDDYAHIKQDIQNAQERIACS